MLGLGKKRTAARTVRLHDPGALLYRTVRLRDGEQIRLRIARPSDAGLVDGLIGQLIGTSAELRHVVGAIDINGRFAYELLHFDPRERMVVCATAWIGNREHLLGLGEVIFRGARAEVRLTVDTAWRKRGIGTALVDAMSFLAGQRGAQEIAAESTVDMRALLARLGETRESTTDGRRLVTVALPTIVKAA